MNLRTLFQSAGSFLRFSPRAPRRSRRSNATAALRRLNVRSPRLEQLEERTLLSVTYLVDDSATGLNTGADWANAFVSLQSALTKAVANDQIHVAQGTYKPTTGTDRNISFALKSGVAIYGGYAGVGAPDPDARNIAIYPSILSADISTVGSTADNSYHVVVTNGANAATVLDGFTITAGNASGTSSSGYGGGMYNSGGSPTLVNCTFIANSAIGSSFGDGLGGGMYNYSSSPTLIDCNFTANSAIAMYSNQSFGGGMYNNNSSSATLINCVFAANVATGTNGVGGGMYNSSSSPRLTNCILWGNTAANGSQISSGSTSVVTYCDVQGGYSGVGNINVDPQFVHNPSPGPDNQWGTADDLTDLRLRLTSPCIDAGSNSALPTGVTTDLAGNPRRLDIPARADTGNGTAPIVDMGAYEAVAAIQVFPGGPYRVIEGDTVVLSGAGYSPNGLSVSYAWDFDADGQYDDATGPSPVFSAVGMHAQTLTIALRVTDTSGLSGSASTALQVVRPLYVDDSAGGLNDGTNWANAYTSLQSALAAAVPGQMIAVGQGTYKPTPGTDRTVSFALRNDVSIYGGYAGYGAADPDARDVARYSSILSGDIGLQGDSSDNSYHVVVASGTNLATVLDGFAITDGNANGTNPNDGSDCGGGMYNSGGNPTLINCTFVANSAETTYGSRSGRGSGGGMFNVSSSPMLINCNFVANSAKSVSDGGNGGAMCNSLSSPTLINCTFVANSAESTYGGPQDNGNGGGMYNNSSSAILINCTFVANSATGMFGGGSGGGMYNSSSSPTLTNCTFTANAAYTNGGGITNSSSSPTLSNCILWGNTADSGGQIVNSSGTPAVTYCDVEGGYSGTGNINDDPQFIRDPSPGPDGQWGTADDDNGDLRLRLWSPATDAGNSDAVPAAISTDLAGNPRFADLPTTMDTGVGTPPIVDLGAYEAVAALDVEAGGPYAVLEGRQVSLQGQGASAQAGTLLYEWDFDGDGQYDDAVGPNPTFSAAALGGPRTLTVGLRLTDSALASVTDTAVVVVAATVAYVDDTAVGLNNGTSWADAYSDLQSALAMSAPGQVIRVAQGTYKPTTGSNRATSFVLRNGVEMYGGYVGNGTADPDARNVVLYPSILSGDIGTVGSTADNSYHVVVAKGTGANTTLDGFTITAGKADGSSSPCRVGGGVYNSLSSLTLADCTFTSSSASDGGGGMYNNSSSLTLINCEFIANSAAAGGGMYNDSSALTLTDCVFTANAASNSGGGMYNNASSLTLTNCTFTANFAYYNGTGIYNSSSSPTLTNCILWGNTAETDGPIYNNSGTPAVTYCDIERGYSGTGNINADPQFVRNPAPGPDGEWGTADDDYGDLRLRLWSPAVDAGNNSVVPIGISMDLAGNPRLADVPTTVDSGVGTPPIVDMGAFEAVAGLDVEAGGPYAVLEGRQVTLHGYGASAQAGTLRYEWDLDGDGQFDDAVGPTPTFSAATLRGPLTLTIGLRLTDSTSASVTDTAVLVVAATTAYVDDTAAGLNNGIGWTDAYNDLQSALAMSAPGQVIRVAQGTYKPTTGSNRTISFVLRSEVGIYGGYAGNGAADPNARNVILYPSTLSGDIGTVGSTDDNSYHVVVAKGTIAGTILDGFTITAGKATRSSASFCDHGGGMYSISSSLMLTNCTFTANSASYGGGVYSNASTLTLTNCTLAANAGSTDGAGMYNSSSSLTLADCQFTANSSAYGSGGGIYNSSSSSTLTHCAFTANSADYRGGGVYNSSSSSSTLTNCAFTANSAYYGGGMYNSASSPALTNCTFSVNSARFDGGGMYNTSSSPTLTNCTFIANSTNLGSGGGIYNNSSSPTLTNCAFLANSASDGGGGMDNYWGSSPKLINCAFTGNSAHDDGGGMENSVSSSPTLTNCVFTANSADDQGGGISTSWCSPTLTNCILWANTARSGGQIINSGSTPVVTYCDVQGGYSGTGNINVDPQFARAPNPGADGTWGTADDDFGDLRLRLASPCIDAGSNAVVSSGVTTDLAGNPRRADIPARADTGSGTAPIVDIGAYEAVAVLQALAGGPYRVIEGGSVVLSGAGYSPNGLSVSYAWDFDGDGQYDDATGPSPVFSTAGMKGPLTLTVNLRLTDAASTSTTDMAVLMIAAAVAYVDDTAVGLNNGASWTDAYSDVQSALAMSTPGQVIRVAQGTYKPTTGTERTASFVLRSGVGIYGGYAGAGTTDPDARNVILYPSILSGDIGAAGDTDDNSFHVVTANSSSLAAVLDGFTITAGNADSSSPSHYGGGMYNSSSSTLTLTNCTFTGNWAWYGGGMYNYLSSPTLTDCTFTANLSGNYGAGMYNNSSSPNLANCTFTANSAISDHGGGIYNSSSSSPKLTNCILWANPATTGEQIYNSDSKSIPVVTYCDIQGGYSGTGNIAADPQFVRNPNPGPDGIWRTADDDYGDLRLMPTSPCIDAGSNPAVPAGVTTDMAGNPRFVDVPGVTDTGSGTAPIVDMGAYESPNPASTHGGSGKFTLGLTPDHASLQIVSPGGTNTYPVATITTLRFTGGIGDDRLTIDFTNGNPLPAGGIMFDAGLQGLGDSLVIQGTAGNQQVTLDGNKVKLGGQEILTLTGVEAFAFELGSAVGTLPGNNGLVKAGPGTLTLAGGNAYLGDTTVLGGKLIVANADALPSGTSLSIHGGSVVLDSGSTTAVKVSGLRFPGLQRPAATNAAVANVLLSLRERSSQESDISRSEMSTIDDGSSTPSSVAIPASPAGASPTTTPILLEPKASLTPTGPLANIAKAVPTATSANQAVLPVPVRQSVVAPMAAKSLAPAKKIVVRHVASTASPATTKRAVPANRPADRSVERFSWLVNIWRRAVRRRP